MGSIPSGVEVVVSKSALTEEQLEKIGVVMLLNRRTFSPDELRALKRFRRRGGGIAFFLGPKVDVAQYGAVFHPDGGESGVDDLFPVDLSKPAKAKGPFRLKFAGEWHSAFDVFRGVEGSSIEQVSFDRFLGVTSRTGARVVARFTDPAATPAIIEAAAAKSVVATGASGAPQKSAAQGSGAGRVVVFNMTADRDWHDWPTDPSFPIVIQEWVRYLSPRLGDERHAGVGGALYWDAAPGVRYDVISTEWRRPPYRRSGYLRRSRAVWRRSNRSTTRRTLTRKLPKRGAATKRGWLPPRRSSCFARRTKRGLYRVIPARRIAGAQVDAADLDPFWFACSRDARESELEAVDLDQLRSELESLDMKIAFGESLGGGIASTQSGGEIWRWLALGAGIFLIIELFVAWWLGRGGA